MDIFYCLNSSYFKYSLHLAAGCYFFLFSPSSVCIHGVSTEVDPPLRSVSQICIQSTTALCDKSWQHTWRTWCNAAAPSHEHSILLLVLQALSRIYSWYGGFVREALLIGCKCSCLVLWSRVRSLHMFTHGESGTRWPAWKESNQGKWSRWKLQQDDDTIYPNQQCTIQRHRWWA